MRLSSSPMDLEPGENVIFEGHPSWRSVLGFYIKGIALAILAGAVAAAVTRVAGDEVSSPLTGGAFVLVVALVLAVVSVRRLFTSYVISDPRLYIRKGIVARHEQQTS